MNIKKYLFPGAMLSAFLFLGSCADEKKEVSKDAPESLPLTRLSLGDLSEFKGEDAGWEIAGKALSAPGGFNTQLGQGVLVKSGDAEGQLATAFDHGDLDLELHFMLAEGASFKLVLQERYPLIIAGPGGDGIIVSGPGEQITPKAAPLKAAGLWQTLKMSFKAPRFDSQGNKVENAVFEEVSLNGFPVHSNIEFAPLPLGGAQSEVATAPLLLIAEGAGVAVKNIGYKSYGLELLTLSDLTYTMYSGTWDKLPDFSQLEPTKSGAAESLSIRGLSDGNDHYGIIFKGTLNVPTSGDYLFTTNIDDGGDLLIDNKMVVHNDGEPGWGEAKGLINLEKGAHDFEMSYFQDVWGSALLVFYEGPGISRKSLVPVAEERRNREREPLVLVPTEEPIAIRSFLTYKGAAKTHPLSIITEEKINYSYDLLNGALIKGWKGAYADANPMWSNRGETQLLTPMAFSVDFSDRVPVARLLSMSEAWPEQPQEGFKVLGYDIDANGYPIINYQLGNIAFADLTQPAASGNGITRSISINSGQGGPADWLTIAAGNEIVQLSNGWYSVDGEYYVVVDEQPDMNVVSRFDKELVVQLPAGPGNFVLTYSIIW